MIGKNLLNAIDDFLFAKKINFGKDITAHTAFFRNIADVVRTVTLNFTSGKGRFYRDLDSIRHSIHPPPTMRSSL